MSNLFLYWGNSELQFTGFGIFYGTRFLKLEIKEALQEINPDKAPGLDGFNGFYIRKLRIMGSTQGDIVKYFKGFYAIGLLTRGINSSFINLIPKVAAPPQV